MARKHHIKLYLKRYTSCDDFLKHEEASTAEKSKP